MAEGKPAPGRALDHPVYDLGGGHHPQPGMDELRRSDAGGADLLRHQREPVGRQLLWLPTVARLRQNLGGCHRHLLVGSGQGSPGSVGRLDASGGPLAGGIDGNGDPWFLSVRVVPAPVGGGRASHLSPGPDAAGSHPWVRRHSTPAGSLSFGFVLDRIRGGFSAPFLQHRLLLLPWIPVASVLHRLPPVSAGGPVPGACHSFDAPGAGGGLSVPAGHPRKPAVFLPAGLLQGSAHGTHRLFRGHVGSGDRRRGNPASGKLRGVDLHRFLVHLARSQSSALRLSAGV